MTCRPLTGWAGGIKHTKQKIVHDQLKYLESIVISMAVLDLAKDIN
jgi:hypothetical protein